MSKPRMAFFFLVTVGLGMNSTGAAPANLLVNPGFETGDLTGWTVGGPNGGFGVLSDGLPIPGVTFADFLPALQNVRSGSNAAYAVTAHGQGEYVFFRQTLGLNPGNYTAGFYMGLDQSEGIGIGNAIEDGGLGIWVDGALLPFNASYPNNFPTGSGPSDFTLFDADFTSAGGLTTIEFRISGSGTARAGISVDDFSLTGTGQPVIPAPGAVWLAAVGGGFVSCLRKRRAF